MDNGLDKIKESALKVFSEKGLVEEETLYSVLMTEEDLMLFSELQERLYGDDDGLGKKLAIGAATAGTLAAGIWAGNKGYLGKNIQAGIKTAGAGMNSMWNKTKTAATNMGNKVGDKFNQIKSNLPQTTPATTTPSA